MQTIDIRPQTLVTFIFMHIVIKKLSLLFKLIYYTCQSWKKINTPSLHLTTIDKYASSHEKIIIYLSRTSCVQTHVGAGRTDVSVHYGQSLSWQLAMQPSKVTRYGPFLWDTS